MTNNSGKKTSQTPVSKQENLPDDVNKVLDELTEEQRRVLMGTMIAMEQRTYSGPLPPAEEIEAYEHVCPGSADRIISMAEKSLENRIANEQLIVKEETKQRFYTRRVLRYHCTCSWPKGSRKTGRNYRKRRHRLSRHYLCAE